MLIRPYNEYFQLYYNLPGFPVNKNDYDMLKVNYRS